jgi:Tfp pilus assembly protein PilO
MSLARRILFEKRRVIWPIAAGVVVNVGLFLLLVYPLSRKVSGGETEARAAASALAAARRDYAAAKATVSGKKTADEELRKFYKDVLPPDESGARRITYLKIYELARESNLRLERRNYDQSQERGSELGKLTATIELSGEYRDVRRFIYALETSTDFLVLENVALSQGEDKSRGLNVAVQVSTYYWAGGNGN